MRECFFATLYTNSFCLRFPRSQAAVFENSRHRNRLRTEEDVTDFSSPSHQTALFLVLRTQVIMLRLSINRS